MNQFDLNKYPTLNKFAQSDAFIKFVIGPAGCLPAETEVLTRRGWERVDKAPSEILVYDPITKRAYFDAVEPVSYECTEGFHRFYNKYAVDMIVSDEHKVWYQTQYDQSEGRDVWKIATGKDLAEQWKKGSTRTAKIPTVFDYVATTDYPLSDEALRVCVMLSADGHLPNSGSKASVTVRKEHKKARVRKLLREASIDYSETTYATRPTETVFRFVPPEWSKDLSRFYSCSLHQLQVIAEECLYWDAHRGEKGVYYTSTLKGNVDFIQFAFCATGTPSIITYEDYPEKGWDRCYRATFSVNKKTAWVNLKTTRYEPKEASDGRKYCFHTKTGMFVMRNNGKIMCTGNSAKTSYMALELFRRACTQAPAEDRVRYSRTLVGRNTYQVLKSATIPTFENMLGWLGEAITFKKGAFPPTAHIRAKLADETYVHWDIEFVSFDTEDAVSKLLGYEPTNAFLDEISELPEELIDSVVRRLGRYPSGRRGKPTHVELLGATNGPRKDHWLYQWYLGARDEEFAKIEKATGRKQFELFKQPGGLIERGEGDWVPNPLAENIENLPNGYGYYYNMLSGDRQRVRAYVEGEFADIVTGKVVYPEFRRDMHIWHGGHDKLPGSMRLYLGFDFGRTPVCTIATATQGGKLIVIDEVMGEDISIDTLCTDYLLPVLRQKYPRSTIEGAWGDPAGNVETQALDVSPFDVLLKHGIPIEDPSGNNKLQPRLEAVKQRLTRLDSEGRPSLLITDNCKYIIEAIGSTYIYEKVRGRNDTVRDIPTKSHEGWCSDLCDALSYLCMGYNALVGVKRQRRRALPSLKRSAM